MPIFVTLLLVIDLQTKYWSLQDQKAIMFLIFNIHSSLGLKLLRRMGLEWRHLANHKFRRNFHDFWDCLKTMWNRWQEIEATTHFLLRYPNYHCARETFFEKNQRIDSNILTKPSSNNKSLTFWWWKVRKW